MQKPAVYRIGIKGELNENWSEYICAQSVSVTVNQIGQATTVIISEPMDQGALVGLINYLNGLGISLLSVEPIEVD